MYEGAQQQIFFVEGSFSLDRAPAKCCDLHPRGVSVCRGSFSLDHTPAKVLRSALKGLCILVTIYSPRKLTTIVV